MARKGRKLIEERRPVKRTMQLTPSEDAELSALAEERGTCVTTYARELIFRRSAEIVAGTRRNPEIAALIRALDTTAHEQNATGNNINQIARHMNTTGELRDMDELRTALARYDEVTERHIAALERVIAL